MNIVCYVLNDLIIYVLIISHKRQTVFTDCLFIKWRNNL